MSKMYGAVKEKLGLASPFEAAYWQPHKIESLIAAAVLIGVPLVGGFAISMVSQKDLTTWYKRIKKPSWTPPGPAFGAAWSLLYVMMGVAAWLVFTKGGWTPNKFALSAWAVQLVLNWAWTPTFFVAKKMDLALADIVLLLGALTTTGLAFYEVDRRAGALFIPYFAWVAFATALNYKLLELNPKYHTELSSLLHLKNSKHA